MISSRIIAVQIAAKPMNITIIHVYHNTGIYIPVYIYIYAPTSEYSDEEIEVFTNL